MRKYIKAITNLVIALAILLIFIFLVPRLLVFFAPFVAGWVIAWIASPFVQFFESRLKVRRKAGSVLVIVLVICMVVGLLYLAGSRLFTELVGLIGALPDIWAGAEQDFNDIAKNLNVIYSRLPIDVQNGFSNVGSRITEFFGNFVGNISSPTISAVGNFAKQLPSILIGIIMSLLSAYLFVAEKNSILVWFRRNTPQSVQDRYRIVKRSLGKAVGGYFKAQLRIEVWMYLLLVIGLVILRVDYAVLIAFLIAFLDFIPFFGTGTVLVPWAVIKILSSDYRLAVGLLIIWGVGQLARQIIQPKIVGDSVGVAPIPTLFLLYIGYRLGGVVGMIIAVPLGLIVFSMYEEGAFDTTKKSIFILVNGINRFRRITPADMGEPAQKQPEQEQPGQEQAGQE